MTEQANLRALFAPGAAPKTLAREVFTDRVGEREAFKRSIQAMSARIGSIDPTDLASPRENVLNFYGIGGIGKSRLLAELERLTTDVNEFPQSPRLVTSRIDMGRGLDVERLLLQLRANFGTSLKRALAFDLTAAAYWERAHAGESLAQFFSRDSVLRKHAEKFNLGEHVKAALAEIAAATVGTSLLASVGTTAAGLLRDRIRASQRYRQLAARLPWFEHLLGADATVDNFAYFSALLAWDIAEEQRRDPLLPIVFVDTLEQVVGAAHRDDESILQRLCFLLPNALWVFGGRDRIDWGEEIPSAELDYSGPRLWPGLSRAVDAETEPRQHLLGYLSPDDCEQYLCDVLRDKAGNPLIDSTVRERIVQGSDGLPLYLDLAVNHFISAAAHGREPDPADFGGPLPSVVACVLRDLTAEERRVLRASCLFSRFDLEMAADASGAQSDAVVRRVLARSYIDKSSPEPFRHSLPVTLRDAVRAVDPQLDDGWSAREWNAAAARALAHLERRWREYLRSEDAGGAEAALGQALEVLPDALAVPDWLYEASELAVETGLWRVLRIARMPSAQDRTARAAFTRGLTGIVERRTGSLTASIELLHEAIEDDLLPPSMSDTFRLHLTNARRNNGEYEVVRGEYEQLCRSPSESVAWYATYQLADLDYLRGDFIVAENRAAKATGQSTREVERLRLLGHVRRFNADFPAATRAYREALEHAEQCGGAGLEAKVRTNLIETWQWSRPDWVIREIDEVAENTKRAGNVLDLCKLAAVRVAMLGWKSDRGGLDSAVADAMDQVEAIGYQAAEVFVKMAECFAGVRLGDHARAEAAANRVAAVADGLGVYGFCAAVCRLWVGTTRKDAGWSRYRWLDERADERWLSAIRTQRIA